MGRVSDAMGRAGYQQTEAGGYQEVWRAEDAEAGEDGTSAGTEGWNFVSGRDEETDGAAYIARSSELKPRPQIEPLTPRQRVKTAERSRDQADADDEVRILDVLSTLYRHRWLVIVVIGVAVAAAVAYNKTAVPIFEAAARLIIEPNSPEVAPFRGASTEDPGRVDYYVTQIEVLRSRALVGKTLERLQLLTGEQKQQIDQVSRVLASLSVAPVKSDMGESRVLNVTYRSPDPELAARIVNGLAQNYVDQNLESRRQGSRSAFESLNQRLAELRNEVTSSQGAVQHYREQKDAVSLGDQQNIVGQKLAQLNQAVTSARMDRLDKQTVYEQLKKIRQVGAPLDTFSPILSNQFVQGLKADLANLQRERSQMSERLGDAHPDMVKLNNSIAASERRLNDEMAKIVDGIENDYIAAQAREKAMNEALEHQKREVLELSQKSIGFSALQRDAASTQQMFDTVLQRVKETELSSELQTNNARILDIAEVPRAPIWPRKQLNLIVALLGGGFLAIGLAFTRDYLNPRLVKQDDITTSLGLSVLGTAPRVNGLQAFTGINALPPSFLEAVRAIRTRILLSPMTGTTRALAITSANPGDGKTVLSTSLAASIAMAGRRVLLVDADMRRPQLHERLKIAQSPGLSELLTGSVKPNEAFVSSASVPDLYLLPAGKNVPGSSEALHSERLMQLIQGFGEYFDVVILDCPPVLPVADATIVAHAAGSVVFVVGSGETSRGDAQAAIERLAAVQVQLVGVVLNKAKPDAASAYHYQPSLNQHRV